MPLRMQQSGSIIAVEGASSEIWYVKTVMQDPQCVKENELRHLLGKSVKFKQLRDDTLPDILEIWDEQKAWKQTTDKSSKVRPR